MSGSCLDDRSYFERQIPFHHAIRIRGSGRLGQERVRYWQLGFLDYRKRIRQLETCIGEFKLRSGLLQEELSFPSGEFLLTSIANNQNLQQIEELRQQLLSYLVDSSLIHVTPAQRQEISQ